MPYSKTTWVDGNQPDIDATNLNNLENGVAAAPHGPDASSNQLPYWNGTNWAYSSIKDAQVDAAAAIAYTKINLTGNIKNTDIATAAAIAYSKLTLTASIADSDIATSTNLHKLAAVTGTPNGTKFLRDDGSWQTASGPGTQLDYAQITAPITGITATTEATAVNIITGNSTSYTATKVKIEFWCPDVENSSLDEINFLFLRDTTVLGQFHGGVNTTGGAFNSTVKGEAFDTPTAGAHTYAVKAFVRGGTGKVDAGAGGSGNLLPAFLRVTLA